MATFAPITRHDMAAPFPDMDGKQIEFTTKEGTRTGEIVTSPGLGNKFGMRIDWLLSIHDDGPYQKTITMGSRNLTKAEISRVAKTSDPNLPFRVTLD